MTKVSIEGQRSHTLTRVVWRFASGNHLDARPRTNATAFHRGTKVLGENGRTIRWSYLSRAERAAWRVGTLAVLSGGSYGYAVAPDALYGGLSAIGAGGTGYAAHRTRRAIRRRQHYREWVRPLHKSLAASPLIAVNSYDNPDAYLSVPVDYATNDESKILMRFPEGFSGDRAVRSEIERIICDKLGISDSVVSWRTAGREPHVTVQIAPRPPKKVLWKDAIELMEKAPESAPVIGIGPRGVPVAVDLNTESPHVLISGGSGAGKSVVTQTLTAQLMRHGAHVIVLDLKRHSQKWLRGLPNVVYCREPAEMHSALISAAAEGDRRNIIIDDEGEEAGAALPRIIILAEEMNATIGALQEYWESVRDKSDSKKSPAVSALGKILFMGRAVRLTVFAIAQMMTARAIGGPEARENFPVRILARYSKNAWQMLVPEIQPMPRQNRHPGRWQVCIAGVATETQVTYGKDGQLREWAESECACHPRTGADSVPTVADQDGGVASVLGQGRLTVVPEPVGPPELAGVSLSQAVADGVLSVPLAVARRESTRDPEFPRSIGRDGSAKLYDPAELMAWQRNRPRAVG
jgi:hypothetical protein